MYLNRNDSTPEGRAAGFDESTLTERQLISLQYIAPPEQLKPFVNTLYYFRCDEPVIRDLQPAMIGQLLIFLRGEGKTYFPHGIVDETAQFSLLTPSTLAVPYEIEGPFHCVGAALTALGWAALTGLRADEHGNRLYRAGDWLGSDATDFGARLCAGYADGSLAPEAICAALAGWIGARLKPVEPRHIELMRALLNAFVGAYDPPMAELVAASGYSERQFQRLIERYFGVPPKQLKRRYRALRVATLLNDPQTSSETIAEVTNLFYDQSHMIRELKQFIGRTPARLGTAGAPILDKLLNARSFSGFKPEIDAAEPDSAKSDSGG